MRRSSRVHGHLAHALGDARRAVAGERAPARVDSEIAVVHNGIIENYEALRERLKAQGYVFGTQTDTEVIAHLVHAHWHGDGGGDLVRAVQAATAEFHGAYAIAVLSTREPGRIVGARAGSPLVVGIGEDDHYLASDAAALLSVTRRIVYLEEGDVAEIRRDSYALYDAAGARAERPVVTVQAPAMRSSSAPIAISCRRRSSSSRARSPTRSKASKESTRRSSGQRLRRFSRARTAY
jgi:glucosamine--fructose-6-phosphate aminotransferase (isomerizing)